MTSSLNTHSVRVTNKHTQTLTNTVTHARNNVHVHTHKPSSTRSFLRVCAVSHGKTPPWLIAPVTYVLITLPIADIHIDTNCEYFLSNQFIIINYAPL